MSPKSTGDDRGLERAVRVIVSAAHQFGADPDSWSRRITDVDDALNALTGVEERLLRTGSLTPDQSLLLLELQSAKAHLLAGQLARQRAMLPVLNDGLAALRTADTIEDLASAVPYHAAQLGYDRALFSWVDQERWVPRSAYFRGDQGRATALLEAGSAVHLRIREVLEVDLVRGRRPLLVLDVEGNPRVHQRMWEVTRSDTYVAAPVVANGHVAAMVHLDRNLETGTTDAFDRDLLAAFCEGVGLMLDRLMALGGRAGETPGAVGTAWPAVLTMREREVLRLVAAGLTNAQIGARLYISEETTKSHVKSLMRKLGVTNRSQAGALYHRLCAGSADRSA